MDAEEMSLEDDSVDGVLCRFACKSAPDPAAALAETRRVLREGGRLALAVWSTAADNPWVAIAGRILAERGLSPPPEPGAPGMFVLGTRRHAEPRGGLENTGFNVERVERVPVLKFEYSDVDDYICERPTWEECSRGSGATLLQRGARRDYDASRRGGPARFDVGGGSAVVPGVAVVGASSCLDAAA